MKVFIKKFNSAESAHNYPIANIPFMTSVATNPIQNLVCNKTGKHLENDNGTVIICPPDDLIIPNNEIHYAAISQVTPYKQNAFGVNYLPEESTFDSTTKEGILKFDGDVTTIGNNAFAGCSDLTSIIIPNSVESIGGGAFNGCSLTGELVIPNSVTSIGSAAFSWCSGLTSVTIGNSVTSIGGSVFVGCSGLTSVTIPSSVTSIENYAFSGCRGLTSITCKATTPPTIQSGTWSNVSRSIPVHVPANSVPLYQQAQYWSQFTDIRSIS